VIQIFSAHKKRNQNNKKTKTYPFIQSFIHALSFIFLDPPKIDSRRLDSRQSPCHCPAVSIHALASRGPAPLAPPRVSGAPPVQSALLQFPSMEFINVDNRRRKDRIKIKSELRKISNVVKGKWSTRTRMAMTMMKASNSDWDDEDNTKREDD
jgi:hypothetical protein